MQLHLHIFFWLWVENFKKQRDSLGSLGAQLHFTRLVVSSDPGALSRLLASSLWTSEGPSLRWEVEQLGR